MRPNINFSSHRHWHTDTNTHRRTRTHSTWRVPKQGKSANISTKYEIIHFVREQQTIQMTAIIFLLRVPVSDNSVVCKFSIIIANTNSELFYRKMYFFQRILAFPLSYILASFHPSLSLPICLSLSPYLLRSLAHNHDTLNPCVYHTRNIVDMTSTNSLGVVWWNLLHEMKHARDERREKREKKPTQKKLYQQTQKQCVGWNVTWKICFRHENIIALA